MDIRDLEPTPPTIDPTPRPRAAQFTRRPPIETITGRPAFALRPSHVFAVVLSGLFLAGLIVLIASFSGSRPVRSAPTAALTPTEGASETRKTLFAPPTRTPVLAPTPPLAPSVAPEPSGDVPGASGEMPPMTGQGLTLAEDAPAVEAPADQYIQNVGAQAPHSPRGGVTGPCDGTCAAVPTITSQQAEVIGQQAPHKVR